MNLTLIGMPASGKSSIGRSVAELLGFQFVDIDKIIEARHGMKLQKIVATLGDEVFIDTETKALLEVTNDIDHTVLAPGGSIVYSEIAMKRLRDVSKIAYLRCSISALENRIGTEPRGIIKQHERPVAALYAERAPLYERYADVTIQGDGDPEHIARLISAWVEARVKAAGDQKH
jgi:shikimate kinase